MIHIQEALWRCPFRGLGGLGLGTTAPPQTVEPPQTVTRVPLVRVPFLLKRLKIGTLRGWAVVSLFVCPFTLFTFYACTLIWDRTSLSLFVCPFTFHILQLLHLHLSFLLASQDTRDVLECTLLESRSSAGLDPSRCFVAHGAEEGRAPDCRQAA